MQLIAVVFSMLLILIQFSSEGDNGSNRISQRESIQPGKAIVFHRTDEPNEKAFSVLLPEGWKMSGGITRIDRYSKNSQFNTAEAKLYLKLTSPDEKTATGWLPDISYIDTQRYKTMNRWRTILTVDNNLVDLEEKPILSPNDYLIQIAFPVAHPHAQNIKLIETLTLKDLAENYRQFALKLKTSNDFNYSASIITFQYIETGVSYIEKMVCVIEERNFPDEGMWGNKETWYVRCESEKFDEMAPLLFKIIGSFSYYSDWLEKEIRKQQINNQIQIKNLRDIQVLEKEIRKQKSCFIAQIIEKMY
jgi:hypothetical protein